MHAQLIDWGLFPRAVLGVVALVCGNGFIVGINQVTFLPSIESVNRQLSCGLSTCIYSGLLLLLLLLLLLIGRCVAFASRRKM